MSIGDLPAVFDYVFNITQEESDGPYFFVCHSMGCAEIAILLSEYTEYNDLFDAVFMMAPPIFMGNRYGTVLSQISKKNFCFFLDNHHCNVVNVLLIISFTVESVFGVGLLISLKISWVTRKFERLVKKDVGLQPAKVGFVIQLRRDH